MWWLASSSITKFSVEVGGTSLSLAWIRVALPILALVSWHYLLKGFDIEGRIRRAIAHLIVSRLPRSKIRTTTKSKGLLYGFAISIIL